MKLFNKLFHFVVCGAVLSLIPAYGDSTELHEAVKQGDAGKVQELLAEGFNPDESNTTMEPAALLLAAQNCNAEIVSVLLEGEANPNIQYPLIDITPLHIAAGLGCADTVLALLDGGADVNAKVDSSILRLTLKIKTQGRAEYFNDHTPAYWASLYKHDDVVEILNDFGAEPAQVPDDLTVASSPLWDTIMGFFPGAG